MRAAAAGVTPRHEDDGQQWDREAALDAALVGARPDDARTASSLLLLALDAREGPARRRAGRRARRAASQTQGRPRVVAVRPRPAARRLRRHERRGDGASPCKALAARDPRHPLLEPAVRWLLLNRTFGAYWASTKQTAMVLYWACSTSCRRARNRRPELGGRGVRQRRARRDARFTAASMTSPDPVEFTAPARAGTNTIRLVATRRRAGLLVGARRRTYDTRGRTGADRFAHARARSGSTSRSRRSR